MGSKAAKLSIWELRFEKDQYSNLVASPQWLYNVSESLGPQGLRFPNCKLEVRVIPAAEGCCEK